jgi:trafficking protein particle complex subunit 11
MDAYPAAYVEHNLPFVLLFGLDKKDEVHGDAQEQALLQSGGFVVKSDLPPVSGERAHQLVKELLKADGAGRTWASKSGPNQGSPLGFRLQRTGRVGCRSSSKL